MSVAATTAAGKMRGKKAWSGAGTAQATGLLAKSVVAVGARAAQPQRQLGAFKTLQIGAHFCYMRAHAGEDDRTMFLVNLPVDTTDRHVRTVFAQAGAMESVRLWKGKSSDVTDEDEEQQEMGEQAIVGAKSGKAGGRSKAAKAPMVRPLPSLDPRDPHQFLPTSTSAHITFLDESSLQRALAMSYVKAWPDPFKGIAEAQDRLHAEGAEGGKKRSRKAQTADEAIVANKHAAAPPSGLDYLLARHRSLRPPLEAVRAHVDSVIANFEWRLKHPKAKSSAIEAVSVGPNGELLDADGFTIVQNTGKYGRTTDGQGSSIRVARSRAQSARSRGDDEGEPAKKKKRLELDDFYRFQRREAKRQELADLRAKFQADQEKVKQLKSSRNFKPF